MYVLLIYMYVLLECAEQLNTLFNTHTNGSIGRDYEATWILPIPSVTYRLGNNIRKSDETCLQLF